MAINTSTKRFSIMNLSSPWRDGIPYPPDGSFDVGNRITFLGLYSGISPTPPSVIRGRGDGSVYIGITKFGLVGPAIGNM